MFREQDMFDRELFVDSTRSVSVVLGEKDNKSVNQNILKSAIPANHFLIAGALCLVLFSELLFEKSASQRLRHFMLLPGSEEENKRSTTGGAA